MSNNEFKRKTEGNPSELGGMEEGSNRVRAIRTSSLLELLFVDSAENARRRIGSLGVYVARARRDKRNSGPQLDTLGPFNILSEQLRGLFESETPSLEGILALSERVEDEGARAFRKAFKKGEIVSMEQKWKLENALNDNLRSLIPQKNLDANGRAKVLGEVEAICRVGYSLDLEIKQEVITRFFSRSLKRDDCSKAESVCISGIIFYASKEELLRRTLLSGEFSETVKREALCLCCGVRIDEDTIAALSKGEYGSR